MRTQDKSKLLARIGGYWDGKSEETRRYEVDIHEGIWNRGSLTPEGKVSNSIRGKSFATHSEAVTFARDHGFNVQPWFEIEEKEGVYYLRYSDDPSRYLKAPTKTHYPNYRDPVDRVAPFEDARFFSTRQELYSFWVRHPELHIKP